MSIESAFLEAFSTGGTDAYRARQDFQFFIENVMLDQRGDPVSLQWFHREICKLLLIEKRVMLLIPRSWGKSTLACVWYPLWRLGNNRDLRILIASNSETRAIQWLQENEKIMLRNARYQETFGYMVPRARTLRWTEKEKVVLGRSHFATHNSLVAVGMGSAILGSRSDIIICDDIVGPNEAYSPSERKRASDWLWTTLLPILEPDGQIIFTGSRWGHDDLYAEIVSRWEGDSTPHLGLASWHKNQHAPPEAKYPSHHTLRALEAQGKIHGE